MSRKYDLTLVLVDHRILLLHGKRQAVVLAPREATAARHLLRRIGVAEVLLTATKSPSEEPSQ